MRDYVHFVPVLLSATQWDFHSADNITDAFCWFCCCYSFFSPALVAVSVISSQCCPQLLLRNFKRSGSRSGVGRVVRCSIYYPAVLAARMTERCATKLSVSTPVPLSDLLHLTPMRMKPGNCRSEESFSENGHSYIY